ncbi:MAG: efflux RND transporter periplasmic adaptor subunit [Thermoanaerobaculia bacterium]
MKRFAPAAAAVLFSVSCSRPQPLRTAEAVPVTAATVEKRSVPVEVTAIGHVEPLATVSIRAQVGGTITRVWFREGQDVQKGEMLLTIDPRPYDAALRQAQAALSRDEAQARNAAAESKRYADLVQKDYVTREQFDQIEANFDALGATVKSDEAAVENAKLQVAYCSITAPISGRTGSLLVKEGNVVKPNDVPLLVINQIQPILASFSIPESRLEQIKRRSSVSTLSVTATAPGGDSHRGELTFVDNAVDPTTGTIALKATFPNRTRGLWPGQFVNLVLVLSTEADAVVVPSPAIQTGQAGPFVYVIKPDSTVESRPVTVDRAQGDLTVVARGLSPGERVVTDGQLRLTSGVRVEIKGSGPRPASEVRS